MNAPLTELPQNESECIALLHEIRQMRARLHDIADQYECERWRSNNVAASANRAAGELLTLMTRVRYEEADRNGH